MAHITKENCRIVNLITSSVLLVSTFLLILSFFFPLFEYKAHPEYPKIFILFTIVETYSASDKAIDPFGILALASLIILFLLTSLNIVSQVKNNESKYIKHLFWTFLLIFYFPASFTSYEYHYFLVSYVYFTFTSMAGLVMQRLTVAASQLAEENVSNLVTSARLTPWYYITLINFCVLYLAFLVIFVLYFVDKELNGAAEAEASGSLAITERKFLDLKMLLVCLGVISLFLICISMFFKKYHWIGSDASSHTSSNFIMGYKSGTIGGSLRFDYYLDSIALWYLLHVIGTLFIFALYIYWELRRTPLKNKFELVFIQLLLLMIMPTSNLESNGIIYMPGFVLVLNYLREIILYVSIQQLNYNAGYLDAKPILSKTVELFLASVIILAVITFFVIYCRFTEKKMQKYKK
ncbi:MAG: hypothetical protein ACTSYD_08755 [Candidatus Heimdallarchaeaceae archaeon]